VKVGEGADISLVMPRQRHEATLGGWQLYHLQPDTMRFGGVGGFRTGVLSSVAARDWTCDQRRPTACRQILGQWLDQPAASQRCVRWSTAV
jgi:hypothetical protein